MKEHEGGGGGFICDLTDFKMDKKEQTEGNNKTTLKEQFILYLDKPNIVFQLYACSMSY